MVKVYTYSNCSTCKDAIKWLKAQGVAFDERPIRETPPSVAELKAMLSAYQGQLKRLFNTSGRDYREQNLGEKLPDMSEGEALGLLSKHGNLVKRPFLLGDKVGLVGFDPAVWGKALT